MYNIDKKIMYNRYKIIYVYYSKLYNNGQIRVVIIILIVI